MQKALAKEDEKPLPSPFAPLASAFPMVEGHSGKEEP